MPNAAADSRRASSSLPVEVRGAIHYAHAASAAAERGLDDQRIADLAGDFRGLPRVGDGFLAAGNARNAGFLRQAPRGRLIAQQVEQVRRGSDENDARAFAGARQGRVLGEKSVPRVNRVHTLLFGQRDDAFHIQVGLHRTFALADEVGFVGLEAVQRQAVFFGIDGDGAQAQFIGGA